MNSLADYYFGAAPARVGFPPQHSGLETALRQPLNCVQLPPDTPPVLLRQFKDQKMLLFSGSILDPEISRNMLFAQPHLRENFIAAVRNRILQIAESGFSAVSLDPGLDMALRDDRSAREAISLIRRLGPVLEETGVELLLPLALPASGTLNPKRIAVLLQAIMFPWVHLQLEIHPHELSPGFDPEQLAGPVAFETGAVLFIYDADAGNLLIREHVQPWLEWFRKFGFYGPYFTAPLSSGGLRFSFETENFIRLVAEICEDH